MLLNIDADLLHTTHGTFQVLAPDPTEPCGAFDHRCSAESMADGPLVGGIDPAFRTVLPGGTVTATVVPEPSIFAFLALAGGLLLVNRRGGRRRA